MLEELVNTFNRLNPPLRRIIFYRDGISEGEFEVVAAREIEQIRNVLKKFDPVPTLTYITAIKNHHVRMIPERAHRDEKSGNVVAGTATGPELSQPPNNKDFYLVSHKGLLGTSRPTHYNILCNDETDILSEKRLLIFTNALCYNFARATTAVSQVTPVYYADLVCQRLMIHLGPTFREDLSEIGSTTSGPPQEAAAELLERVRQQWRPVNPRLQNEMYFL